MKYRYTGVTRQRERVTGFVDANDEPEARLRLRAMQIRPDSLQIAKDAKDRTGISIPGLRKAISNVLRTNIKLKTLIIFTKQFSSLIDSGVPVVQCLDILALQERRGIFRDSLVQIKNDIEAGSTLAGALSKHPRIFSEFFVRIVEAGELSGTLDKSVREMGEQLDKLDRLRAKVIGALMYPAFTLVVAVGVLVFLLVKVFPEISKLYTQTGSELPALTQFVLGISVWTQEYYLVVILGAIASGFGLAIAYKQPSFRAKFDPIILRVPFVGSLILRSAVAQLTRTLSTLISSGVPLIGAFEICEKLIANRAIKEVITFTKQAVQEGRTIAQGISVKNVFPPMVVHMVNIGEMTGRLDELLGKIARIYDDEVDDAIGNLTGILQPAIIVVVGVLIAFLVLAMYLPVFTVAEKMSGA